MNKNYSLETKKPENQTSLKPFKPKFQMYSTLHKLERTICMIPGFCVLCQMQRDFQHIYLPQRYMYKAPLPISWEIQFSFMLLYKTFNLALASPNKFPFSSEEKKYNVHVHVTMVMSYII